MWWGINCPHQGVFYEKADFQYSVVASEIMNTTLVSGSMNMGVTGLWKPWHSFLVSLYIVPVNVFKGRIGM